MPSHKGHHLRSVWSLAVISKWSVLCKLQNDNHLTWLNMATNIATQQHQQHQPGIWVDGRCRCHSAFSMLDAVNVNQHTGWRCTKGTTTPLNLWAAKCSSYHLLTKRTTAEDIMMICANGKIVAHVVVVVKVVEVEAEGEVISRSSSSSGSRSSSM